ncbi:LysR family transcriptional regulator [Marinomonas sp. 5E14-1]|uniref:LysR family transcriptional regulator n=1 Tax=Marinomonas sp. 5E14-1 TaxID=3153922 RepID=UPI0032633F80
MEIISLKTFTAIVDEGGIKGASEALHTVPSNISMRIQKLEDELDVKLFTLTGRKLELTSVGALLYDYAKQITQLEYHARTVILENKGLHELKIGTTETFAAVHLPYVLKKLKKTRPHTKPKIVTATTAELITAVHNNKVDCAFVGSKVLYDNLLCYPIIEEDLILVEPLNLPYNPVLIVREMGCGYREAALNWQSQVGKTQEERMTMSSVEGVLGCVAAGLGYTVIGAGMVKNSRYESLLSTQPANEKQPIFNISLICQKNNPLVKDIEVIAGSFKTE